MKKNVFIFSLLASCMAILSVSCLKVNEDLVPGTESGEPNIHTLSVRFPELSNQSDGKVSLATTGKTQWEVGDKLVIFGQGSSSSSKRVVHEIVAKDIEDPEQAVFEVDFSNLVPEDEASSSEFLHAYNVVYPYIEGDRFYSGNPNYGRARFHNTNQLLMAGYVNDDLSSITLFPVTAAITFSVEGDFDSYIFSGKNGDEVVGYSQLEVEMNSTTAPRYRQKYKSDGTTTGPLTSISGTVNGDGEAVNYVFLPVNAQRSGSSPDYTYDITSERKADVVYLPDGFTIQFLKNGVIKKYITSKAALVLKPGRMINLGVLPADKMHDHTSTAHASSIPIGDAKLDLGAANGTANSYFINPDDAITNDEGSIFKFEAVKGNSSQKLEGIASVSVLWRTFNNATTPGSADVIKAVDYDETGVKTYIVFQLPDTKMAGNAVIAAKNSLDEILWSWHIWVPSTAITANSDHGIFARNIMDRNLGALVPAVASDSPISIQSLGLYYQWGRKDPFVSPKDFGSSSAAAVAGTAWTIASGQISLDYSISHPTEYGIYDSATPNNDWLSTSNNDLWGNNTNTKTMYDPCPPGYKVPSRDDSNTFFYSKIVDGTNHATGWAIDATNHWFTVGDPVAVFPLAGKIDKKGKYDGHSKDRAHIWNTKRANDMSGCAQYIYIDSGTPTSAYSWNQEKAIGGSIRCIVVAP